MADLSLVAEPRTGRAGEGRFPIRYLWAFVALLGAWLLFYSETESFSYDEGFHLLTAQLILRGWRPYIDFPFPQAPLNAYWNALWMHVFGETWRTAHAVQVLGLIAAMALLVDYILRRALPGRWRIAAAFAAALLIGLNTLIVQFGTLGQAYGFALVLIVAAFRLAIAAVGRSRWLKAGLAGLCAGSAAAGTLLAAPVAPILLLWILVYNRAGRRMGKAVAFVSAVIIAFLPLIVLFVQSPRAVIFDVIKYHLYYRQVGWGGAIPHDIYVLFMWVNSGQGLLLILLAAAGLLFIRFGSGWPRELRAEFYLCAWLSGGLALHLSTAHPTFGRYFLLAVPFMSVLAAIGLFWTASKLYRADRPLLPVLLIGAISLADLGEALYESRGNMTWYDLESVARKVDEVTPRGAPLLASEHIFFLTRRIPEPELASADTEKLQLPASELAPMHIVPAEQMKQRVEAGRYATAETCHDDYVLEVGPKVYAQHAEISNCDVYWERKASPGH